LLVYINNASWQQREDIAFSLFFVNMILNKVK
jgi:hypothetical protein